MKTILIPMAIACFVSVADAQRIVTIRNVQYSEQELKASYESVQNSYAIFDGIVSRVGDGTVDLLHGEVIQVVDTNRLLVAVRDSSKIFCLVVPSTADAVDGQKFSVPVIDWGVYEYVTVQGSSARVREVKMISWISFKDYLAALNQGTIDLPTPESGAPSSRPGTIAAESTGFRRWKTGH